MRVLKKYILTFLTVLFFIALPTLASANDGKIIDSAGLFNDEETNNLEHHVQKLIATYQMDAVIMTTNYTEGKSTRDFAADYYDYNGYGIGKHKDGFIFLIDMENRDFRIVTTGKTKAFLEGDNRINNLLDNAEPYMKGGHYAEAALSVINDVKAFYQKGMPSGYSYDEETGEVKKVKKVTLLELGIAFVVASIGAITTFVGVSSKYKLQKSTYSYAYRNEGTLNLTRQDDQLIDTRITRRHIPRPTNNGGGSGGSFTSSSGTSHGGGGRSF